jgi:hypothetical protein
LVKAKFSHNPDYLEFQMFLNLMLTTKELKPFLVAMARVSGRTESWLPIEH